MSGELGGLLRGHEAGLEAAAAGRALTGTRQDRAVGRARRARVVRGVAVGAAAVAVVAVVGAGTWLALGRPDPAPPVDAPVTTSPGPSPTSSPTPTSSPSPTGEALVDPGFSGTVTVSDHLPTAQPVTPRIWADAGPGWVLASYRETGWGADVGPQVIYLVAPDGVRYELVQLSTDALVHVVAWQPQRTSALVWKETSDSEHTTVTTDWARLDLVSGVLTPIEVDAGVPWSSTILPDGRVSIGDGKAVDVDGTVTSAAVEAPAALATASAQYPDDTCEVVTRYDASSVILTCEKPLGADATVTWTQDPVLLRAWDDGSGRVEVLAEADGAHHDMPGAPWGGAQVVDGSVLVTGGDWSVYGCPTGRYRVDGGRFTMLPGVAASSYPDPNIFTPAGASGASVYTVVTAGCSGDMSPETLVRDDLATGEHVELVGYPPDGQGLLTSLNGYYVVP